MAKIKFEHIYKDYIAGHHAVNNFNLVIDDGEFVVFVGPSGCGKSTTLRMVAGLEEITSGKIYIDDKLINDLHPKDREIAMVFQNYALYPHMSVYDNMSFGLKMKNKKDQTIHSKVNNAADILGLVPYFERKPKELSGGQRQRVALGRAIVQNAKVFLMDEPLSNLDAKLRAQTRAELIRLHNQLNATTIYVTHDQTEAMSMATIIVVMNEGVIQQVGKPKEIYLKPQNVFVAGFIGSPAMNFIDLKLQGDTLMLDKDVFFHLPDSFSKQLIEQGYDQKTLTFGVRPEVIKQNRLNKSAFDKCFNATVEVSELIGSETLVHFSIGSIKQIAKFYTMDDFKLGQTLDLYFDIRDAHFFDKESGDRIILKNEHIDQGGNSEQNT